MANLSSRGRIEKILKDLMRYEEPEPGKLYYSADYEALVAALTIEMNQVKKLAKENAKREIKRELIAKGKDVRDFDLIAEDF